MIGNEENIKYKEIINLLHSLQQVKTPAGFEADLMRKINSGLYKEKRSFLESLLLPSRLIPSSIAAAAVVVFLLVFNSGTNPAGNPLMEDPRIREDISPARVKIDKNNENVNNERSDRVEKKLSKESAPVSVPEDKYDAMAPQVSESAVEQEIKTEVMPSGLESSNFSGSASNGASVISKNGLNFRQINLTDTEKAELNRLKEKIKALWGSPAKK